MFNVNDGVIELKTKHELINTCKKKGHILIIGRPAKNNRIHSASCPSLHRGTYDPILLNSEDCDLGTSKSKKQYFFSETLSMLEYKIRTEAIRAIKCKLCD